MSESLVPCKVVFFPTTFLIIVIQSRVGKQEHPKSPAMAKFQWPHSDAPPPFLLFCICHQAFLKGALMGDSPARDLSSHAHAHLACFYSHSRKLYRCLTRTSRERDMQGISCWVWVPKPCRAPAEGCGLTPLAVCVTVSHGKQRSPGELQARG